MAWWVGPVLASGAAVAAVFGAAAAMGGRLKPDAPRGVAIEHADGSRTELEVVFVGRDADGSYLWETAAAMLATATGDRLVIGELPPATKVRGPLLLGPLPSEEEETG